MEIRNISRGSVENSFQKKSNKNRWRASCFEILFAWESISYLKPKTKTTDMKLLLTAFCAAMITSPFAFADKCEKGKCDKEKQESTLVAEAGKCDKCKKGDDADKKEEGTLVAEAAKCEKCKDGKKCEKCKKAGEKEEGTLAEGKCDKCKKGDADKKEEGTLAEGKCKKGKCDKDEDKEESTIAKCDKCKKGDDAEKKEEGTLA